MKTKSPGLRQERSRHSKPAPKPFRTSPKTTARKRTTALPEPRQILVPLNFSKPSRKALRHAIPFAQKFDAVLHLACVLEPDSFLNGVENLALALPKKALAAEARRKLMALAADEIGELAPVKVLVRRGRPGDEILKLTRQLKIDLIIIATHGYTGSKQVLLGSTATRVVREAPCPVLVVRAGKRAFVPA